MVMGNNTNDPLSVFDEYAGEEFDQDPLSVFDQYADDVPAQPEPVYEPSPILDTFQEIEEARPTTEAELMGQAPPEKPFYQQYPVSERPLPKPESFGEYQPPRAPLEMLYSSPVVPGFDGSEVEQTGVDLYTPYPGINSLFTQYTGIDRSSADKKSLDVFENVLVDDIISTIFLDSSMALPGDRSFDKLFDQKQEDEEPFYLDPIGLGDKRLYDREEYAKRAYFEILKQLQSSGAPSSLKEKLQKKFVDVFDDYSSYTPDDIIYMADQTRNQTSKTYKQMGGAVLNLITTPLQFAIAGQAGRPRGPGEPHDSPIYYISATNNDAYVLENTGDVSRLQSAERIANRSYNYSSPVEGKEPRPVSMSSSDILYISDPKVIGPWQEGLKKHIEKVYPKVVAEREDMGTFSRALADRETMEAYPARVQEKMQRMGMGSAEEVYESIKNLAAYSYVDAIESEFGDFLEGYPGIKPPEGGWSDEEAGRLASDDLLNKVEYYLESNSGPLATFGRHATFDAALANIIMKEHDEAVPERREQINRLRLESLIEKGRLGDVAQKNPEVATRVLQAASVDPNRYGSVLEQYTREFIRSMGPEVTGKMVLMTLAGAKKYLAPSLIPGADVGGMLSFDIADTGIPEERVDEFWKEVDEFWTNTPGIGVMMLPGVTKGIGVIGSRAVRVGGTGARIFNNAQAILKNDSLTKKEKNVAIGQLFTNVYESADTGQFREKAAPVVETVHRVPANKAFPVTETPTSLRNKSSEYRAIAADDTMDSGTRSKASSIAQSYEASANIAESILLEKQNQANAESRVSSIRESLVPTLDRADASTSQLSLVRKAETKHRNAINRNKKDIEANKNNPRYVSKGEESYNKALYDIASELGYLKAKVSKDGTQTFSLDLNRFKQEYVQQNKQLVLNKLIENGVTDPLVYQQLMPEAPLRGPKGITNQVLKAERSKAAKLKAEYNAEMQAIADMRNVPVEQVKSEVNKLSIAEDMVSRGVTKLELYALLLDNDMLAREYQKKAQQNPQTPYIRPKIRGVERPFEGGVEVPKGLTPGRVLSDAPYGVARTVFGRQPANIISNRLAAVKGKKPARAAAELAEASMLAVFEFMQQPYAVTNFPSWMGDFIKYLYFNSSSENGFNSAVRNLARNLISPSTVLGERMNAELIQKQGRIEISELQMEAMAKRLGEDESALKARIGIDKAMTAAGLEHLNGGDAAVNISPRQTLTGKIKESIATAFFASDDAYVDIPDNSPTGSSRIYIKDVFDIEYKTPDGEWVQARAASDLIGQKNKQIQSNKDRLKVINSQLSELDDMSISSGRTDPASVQKLILEANGLRDENLILRKEINDEKARFGTAQDVFRVENGKITGVTDIRFNLKDTYTGVVGDAEKTALAVLNTYVQPIQNRVMELAANLAIAENAFNLSVTAPGLKNVVTIQGANGKVIVKKFTGKDASRRASEYAQKINEESVSNGGSGTVASVGIDTVGAFGEKYMVARPDLKFDGYNAVDRTAGYMSAYFSENAVLDFLYNAVKEIGEGKMSQPQIDRVMNQTASLVVASYPERVINKIKRPGMSDVDVAREIYKQVESGKIKPSSAAGSGRNFKERLWAKNIPFKDIEDLYALYSESALKTVGNLTKRVEYYKFVNFLRDNGLVLTDTELSQLGRPAERSGFVTMESVSRQFPGLIDDIKGAYIHRDVADGLILQQEVINVITDNKPVSLGVKANRFLKRAAIVSYLNGTMARNFLSGVLVQAQMAEIPATMRYFKKALEANRAILRGEKPSDPLMLELSERLGGPGRGIKDVQKLKSQAQMSDVAKAQHDYVASVLSGDKDAPALGVTLNKLTSSSQKDLLKNMAKSLDPNRTSASQYGEAINVSRISGQEKFNVGPGGLSEIPSGAKRMISSIDDKGTQSYGLIDATLRLAYAYEIVKGGKANASDASILGRKVFYDHPDVPRVAAKLRDAPLLGLPFVGHMVWSTKAAGNYVQRNPYRGMINAAILNASNEATRAALNLASLYESGVQDSDEGFDELTGMPMIATSRSTERDRRRLEGKGVPKEMQDFTFGQVGFKDSMLRLGVPYDSVMSGYARLFSDNISPTTEQLFGEGIAAAMNMLGSYVDRQRQEAKKSSSTNDIVESLSKDQGVVDTAVESAMSMLGAVIGDVRGLNKIVSSYIGEEYAGIDSTELETVTNALGLAMKIKDLRMYNENFNSRGKQRIAAINQLLEKSGETFETARRRGDTLDPGIQRQILIRALREFEADEDVFNKKRKADGVRMKRIYIDMIQGLLDLDPTNKQFQDSLYDLIEYFPRPKRK